MTQQLPSPLGEKKNSTLCEESSTSLKTHTRKASSGRRIEYQLLQETDVSLSPPKSDYSSLFVKGISDVSTSISINQQIVADPFDINWSQKVLEETARQHQKNSCSSTWPRDAPEAEKTLS
jgi:hypothetical protein